MNIRQLQFAIDASLVRLGGASLLPSLQGRSQLPLSERNPRVVIRDRHSGRKVREDRSDGSRDPDRYEVVIRFDPVECVLTGPVSCESGPEVKAVTPDLEKALGQLIDVLRSAEQIRGVVGYNWFRDEFLQESGQAWALDGLTRRVVLRYAVLRREVLANRTPRPDRPTQLRTAIGIQRRNPIRHWHFKRRQDGFAPVTIRGGPISGTVLGDRR